MAVEPGSSSYALQLSDPERVRYREMAKRARAQEGDRWQRYGVLPGARVADIGCGPGAVLVQLAALVVPGGHVVGVEPDPAARSAAEEEIAAAGVENAGVVAGEGIATTIEPDSVDVVMIRHVLFHVGRAAGAVLRHAASLLRPGGHLYVVDSDVTGVRRSVEDEDLAEQSDRYSAFQRSRGNSVDLGTHLGPLVAGAGLEVIEHEGWFTAIPARFLTLGGPVVAARRDMLAAGVISEADARRYDEAAARVARIPHAVMFTPLYVAVGRRPA